MEVEAEAELCFPQLFNISCRKPTSRSKVVLLNILVSAVSLLTAALNLLVIISVSHFRQRKEFNWYIWHRPQLSDVMCNTVLLFLFRQLHTPTNILLLSLAVSDFLVGLVLLPGEILRRTSCWILGDVMCSLYKFLASLTISASIGDLVLISAERYVAICDPLLYPTRVTVPRVRFCVSLCWFCSGLYSSVFMKADVTEPDRKNSCYGECAIIVDYITGTVDIVLSFIFPITVIIVLYSRVFVVAVSQARAMRCHIKTVSLQRSVTAVAKKSELKAARTLGVLVVVFLICFCPYYCVSLAGDTALNGSSASYVIYLFYFNSCLNPVIYTLFYPWFRRAIKLIVTFKMLQPGSCDTDILQRGAVE